jgi:hypothetical protein
MMTERSRRPTKPPPHFSREGVLAGPFGESLETVRASGQRLGVPFRRRCGCGRAGGRRRAGKGGLGTNEAAALRGTSRQGSSSISENRNPFISFSGEPSC